MRNSLTDCVDANCVVRLVADPDDTAVQELWKRWASERRRLIAPALLLYEVTNALYRYVRYGQRTAASMHAAPAEAIALPIDYHGDAELHRQALVLAGRFTLPAASDAHYLALAERFSIDFWTTDRKLVNAVSATLPWVRLVGE